MIGQVFKMFWYDRKKYVGVLLEQVLIFVILLMSVVSLFEAISKYREPGLINTDDVVITGHMLHGGGSGRGLTEEEYQKVVRGMDVIIEKMRKEPYVVAITRSSGLAPYLRSDEYYVQMYGDTVKADDKAVQVVVKRVDREAKDVFSLELEEGTWMRGATLEDGSCPVVLSRQLADELGWKDAVGRKLFMRRSMTVVGVIAGVKQDPFTKSPAAILVPLEAFPMGGYEENAAKIKPGYKDEFHNRFSKEFKRLGLAEVAVQMYYDMDQLKDEALSETIFGIGILAIPTVFLLLFAFIGTFGLFWLNAKKRRVEFALRTVVGATRRRLMALVVVESLVLSVVAAVPGMLLFCFVYEWRGVQVAALAVSFGVMVLFGVFSAWWPAYQVSRVNPVEAMREV